jgi:hypothetical protein
MKSFKKLFNESAANCVSSKEATGVLLDIQFNGDIIHLGISQRQLVGLIGKLRGGSKKRLFIQLLECSK